MKITSVQKVIKVGSSAGVTLPAKELKQAGVKVGDELEITIRKKSNDPSNDEVLDAAKSILKRYKTDFKNLAQR